MKKVAVIGAGISGLCVAYRAQKAGADVTLFDASDRLGGNIHTVTNGAYTYEHGPNSLMANGEIFDLIDDLGLRDKVLATRPAAKTRYILRDGQPVTLPGSIVQALTTKAFSVGGRLRVLKEPFISSKTSPDESVYEFIERRIGREMADYAIDPFVSGIYAGDPRKLSLTNAFPKFQNLEATSGSLIKGALFGKRMPAKPVPEGAPRMFSFNNGMQTLVDGIAENLTDLRLQTAVERLAKHNGGYLVNGENFDAVALSTPARATSKFVAAIDADAANRIESVYYPPIAVVYASYKKDQVGVDPDGFGILIPGVEKRDILGALFTSSVFDGRAPVDEHLFTIFVGGSRRSELCDETDDKIKEIATSELASIMRITGEPVFTDIKRWQRAIPQYNIGYEKVTAAVDRVQDENPGLIVCSNFYKGIAVGECVKNSITAAERLLS
ncbi:MAG TPA: protoporphyrinogen oxidase [Pyrinomonadaceae bacterium]|nr:protoporphyrinogen oxidase [Pyrinomonadaceae bacterium]